MRFSSSLKSLFRTPVKTLIIFLLLAAVSFALFSRVGEYAVTSRELNRIARNYMGVGAVEREAAARESFALDDALMLDERLPARLTQIMGDEYEQIAARRYAPLTEADIETIGKLPYISRTSTRYMTAGVSEDGFLRANTNDNYYNYNHRLIIEGTYSGIRSGWGFGDFPEIQNPNINMTNLKVLAGEPEILANVAHYFPFYLQILTFPSYMTENPVGHVFKRSTLLTNAIIFPEFDFNYTRTLNRGERYVFTAIFNPSRWLESPVFTGDRAMQIQWHSIYPVSDKPDNYIETEEFSDLRDLIALVEDDRSTFDMVYTDDMRAITRFHNGDMRITEGRILTPSDSQSGANVCVVSKRFINDSKLGIGDVITVRLGDALHNQNAAIGAVSVIKERRPERDKITELEIVGIYDNFDSVRAQTDNPYWNYSNDTIFLPLSLLPETAAAESIKIRPGEFSFIVEPRNISAFLRETAPVLENEMGLTLLFSDGGWLALETHFDVSGTMSVISIIGFSLAVFITLLLTVFLFIERKKREYAIMRALGVRKPAAERALFVPLFFAAFSAVICGGAAGFIYSERMISESLGSLIQSNYSVDVSVPFRVFFLCMLAELVTLGVLTLLGLRRLGLIPPLLLLQGGVINKKADKKKKDVSVAAEKSAAEITSEFSAIPIKLPAFSENFSAMPRKFGSFRFFVRHIFLRNSRALPKTALAILLTAVFSGAIGQFAVVRHTYQVMYESMEVKGIFTNGLTLGNALLVAEKGFTENPYYERVEDDAEINGLPARMCMTSDLKRFVGDSAARVEYAPGFDESTLVGEETYCVLGADLMDALGVSFGDEIQVYLASVRARLKEQNPTIDEIIFDAMLRRGSTFYTVVGRLESDNSHEYESSVFVPVNFAPMPMYRSAMQNNIRLTYVEFTLADNTAADEFRDYAIWILGALDGGRTFILDMSELESVRSSMELWNALFPVAGAALLTVGGLLPGLMILNTAKEAAIFRILGATKKRTRVILSFSQLSLCLPGIALGLLAALLYNGIKTFGAVAETVLICAALYLIICAFTTGFGAFVVTKHKILELMQSKE